MLFRSGVVVVGASTHPGKFGFVALHNLLASKYEGNVAATNLARETVLGVECVASVDDLAPDTYDLAVLCTPAGANEDIVRAYQNAKTAGLYAQVKSVDGSVGAAYASNNEKEYFAEITEAYFLKNDFFPFTREELRSYDPGGYALVENLWLKR